MRKKRISLGQFFKKKRIEYQMSQRELAVMLGYRDPQFISNWERGLAAPPLRQARSICDILKIDKRQAIDLIVNNFKQDVEDLFRGNKT
jgi:transcriptional regulator with XRE-family HTH domain